MTPSFKLTSLLVLSCLTSCSLQHAQSNVEDAERLGNTVNTAIHSLMSEYDVPGMAVAVTFKNQPFYFNYGVASRESHTPVNEHTLFEIGSISKTFTGTLAAYAQVLGKLSLEDHPGRYLPQLQGSAINQVSLLHLGTYTAGGLPLQMPDEVAAEEQMIHYFRQWQPSAAPGAMRTYSNPSIGLFGRITGIALGSDFSDAMTTQLLPKLGLRQSYLHVPEHALGSYAWGYNAAQEPIRVNPGMFDAEAYGLKSTAADMLRFVQVNIDPSKLEDPVRRAIDVTHLGRFKVGGMVQGLGWEQYPYPVTLERLLDGNSRAMILEANGAEQLSPPRRPTEPTLFNKTGSTNGFGAYVAFVPERKIGIVMLANRNIPTAARIKAAHAILEQLAP